MVTIGITGGIGSGKSTVAKLWGSLGAYVLNADDLAKKMMSENDQIREEIIAAFGKKSYNDDGSLNRLYLAEEAFAKGRAPELNQIVHPRIPEEAKRIMAQAKKEGYTMFVYEAALLLQKGRPKYLDYVVLVLTDKDKRLERVMGRDDASQQEIMDRMNMQQDFSELMELADILIDNNGSLKELKMKAGQYYQVLTESEPDIKR